MDNRVNCSPPGQMHDYIPDQIDPRMPNSRTATCRHCGHMITATK